jgi:hypothetical protein
MTDQNTTPPDDEQADAEEKRAYDDLASRASGYLRRTQEVTAEAIAAAVAQARTTAQAAGEFSSEQIERASKYLNRDLLDIQRNSDRARSFFTKSLAPSRLRSGFLSLASDVLERAGSGLSSLSDRLEAPLLVHTGEVTGPGALTCVECGGVMRYEDSGRVPPCPRCHKTAFRKSY